MAMTRANEDRPTFQKPTPALFPSARFGSVTLRAAGVLYFALAVIPLLARAQMQNPALREAGPYRIAGKVVSAAEGTPLSRARVTLQDVRNRRSEIFVITADDGRFEFANLPAGKFALSGAKRGYITSSYDQHDHYSTAIVTGTEFDTSDLTLRLAPVARLTGHVLDEFGDPVRNASVSLWLDDHSSGISRTVIIRTETSDDQGFFEFTPLDAGTYFLSVSARPWYAIPARPTHQEGMPDLPAAVDPALDAIYLPTYYAGANDLEDASPILVRGGDRLDFDLHLMPVPPLHVTLHVPQSADPQSFRYPMLFRRSSDGSQTLAPPQVQMISRDLFEVTAAPGKYQLNLQGRDGTAEAMQVDISEDKQEIEASSAQANSTLSAKVELPGEPAIPPGTMIALRIPKGLVIAAQPVDANHELTFSNVLPGKYEILAGSPRRALAVVRMVVNGAPVAGHSLTMLPGTTMNVALTLVGGSGDISGVAQRSGKAVAGAMVVLVPKNPESHREIFRRDQSDLDGTFIFQSVIPGDYTVIAIENGWDLDWSKPAILARYTVHGEPIVVPPGAKMQIQLPKPVEIQRK